MKKLLFEIGIFTAALSGVFAFEEESSDSAPSQQVDPIGQKKPSFFAIVDSIQGLMPLKRYDYLGNHLQIWPKEKPYDWKKWRQHIKNRLSCGVCLIGQSLIELTLMNGVVNLIKGITPYPNSVETWKQFFTNSFHFRQNQKELRFIQNIELMRYSLWRMMFGCNIGSIYNMSLEQDLIFFLQGTLIGGTKTGLIYAAVMETLNTVFAHLNCLSFIDQLDIEDTKKKDLKDNKVPNAGKNMNWLIVQLTPFLLSINPSWKQLNLRFSKEWNVYVLLTSLYSGIQNGIDEKKVKNTWDCFKHRIKDFFVYPLIFNSLLVGFKNGSKYAALQFGLTEVLYRALADSCDANFRQLYHH